MSINLTKEQKDVYDKLVKNSSKERIQTLGGFGGTGKTVLLSFLANALPNYAVCAFTGKAVNVIRRKGMDASTIHSLIYKPQVNPTTNKVEFLLKDRYEIGCSGFLVDEASMVSKEINEDLLSFKLPIIYVGDHGQLEPVGSNINVMANPQYRLETIHRNAGEIAFFAEHIRKGGSPRDFANKDKVKFATPEEIKDEMLLATSQMICVYNKTRVAKNEIVRNFKGYKKLVEVGEKVMCLRNNKRSGLFNGMQGTVDLIYKKGHRFDFLSDGMNYQDIHYDPNQFGKEKNQFEFGVDTPDPFDYAYCITCHKSQGDEWEYVMVFEQICDKWEHKRWAYTAASRAKEGLMWVCPAKKTVYMPDWL